MSENAKRTADEVGQGDSKKLKTTLDDSRASSHPDWTSLEAFKLVKILRDDAQSKSMCVHAKAMPKKSASNGTTEEELQAVNSGLEAADAIILLEKTAFDTSPSGISSILSQGTGVKQLFNNDIYGTYNSLPPSDMNCKLFVGCVTLH